MVSAAASGGKDSVLSFLRLGRRVGAELSKGVRVSGWSLPKSADGKQDEDGRSQRWSSVHNRHLLDATHSERHKGRLSLNALKGAKDHARQHFAIETRGAMRKQVEKG